jgi:hypothetical protein
MTDHGQAEDTAGMIIVLIILFSPQSYLSIGTEKDIHKASVPPRSSTGTKDP